MEKFLRNMMLCIVLSVCLLLFSSCSGGIKGAEAKAHINDFFAAIVDEDYSHAENLLHPERPANLKEFFTDVEESQGIDFQEGIEIERYTGFSSALYDSTVKGSTYELTMYATVGEKKVEFTIEVVRNEAGFGIYNFDLNA